jgi:hypothetical protein
LEPLTLLILGKSWNTLLTRKSTLLAMVLPDLKLMNHGCKSVTVHLFLPSLDVYTVVLQGDEIYLARGVPSPETINNYTMWEFYGGKDEANNDIWTGSLAEARPLFEWESRTGVVTMTSED